LLGIVTNKNKLETVKHYTREAGFWSGIDKSATGLSWFRNKTNRRITL